MITEEKLKLIETELSQILGGQDIFIVLEAFRLLIKGLFVCAKEEASETSLEFLDSLYIKFYQKLKNYEKINGEVSDER
jgi:hypothetical protein